MNKRRWLLSLLLGVLVLFTSACGSAANANSSSSGPSAPPSFTIAYQPGVGSITLLLLKVQNTLVKQFPHTNFQWKVYNSGAAVRTAVIAGQAQLGSMGLPPFLVGWAGGFNWKVLAASSLGDSWLVATNPKFQSLKDFGPNDKIAVVAPDSQQAIILRKAAQEQLGNAHALDSNLVTLSSAAGEAALLSGHIAAQLSGAPYQEREVAAGGHIIFHSTSIFGPVGTGIYPLPVSFYNQYPAFSETLYKDIIAANAFAVANHAQDAQYLSKDLIGGGGTAAQFQTLLGESSTLVLQTTPTGLISYGAFMKSIGLISKAPTSISQLELPPLNGAGS
jgi:NitT/TauT family transport system substrate-binding protein